MRSLLKYEILKLIKKRVICLMIVILTVVNAFQVYLVYNSNHSQKEIESAYAAVYEKVKGPFTSSKIDFVISNYNKNKLKVQKGQYDPDSIDPGTYTGHIFGDMGLFYQIKEKMNRLYSYQNNNKKIVEAAKENIDFYSDIAKQNEVLINNDIAKRYSNRNIKAFYDTEGFEMYFHVTVSMLFIMLIIAMSISSIISDEYESSMYYIIKASAVGFNKLKSVKLLAAIIFSSVIYLIFRVLNLVYFSIFFKLDSWLMPVYSLKGFEFTQLNINVLEFVLVDFLCGYLAILIFTLTIFLFAGISKSGFISFIISCTITGLFVAFMEFFDIDSFVFAPFHLTNVSNIVKEYSSIIIGNRVIPGLNIEIMYSVLIICILIGMNLIVNNLCYKHNKKDEHNVNIKL